MVCQVSLPDSVNATQERISDWTCCQQFQKTLFDSSKQFRSCERFFLDVSRWFGLHPALDIEKGNHWFGGFNDLKDVWHWKSQDKTIRVGLTTNIRPIEAGIWWWINWKSWFLWLAVRILYLVKARVQLRIITVGTRLSKKIGFKWSDKEIQKRSLQKLYSQIKIISSRLITRVTIVSHLNQPSIKHSLQKHQKMVSTRSLQKERRRKKKIQPWYWKISGYAFKEKFCARILNSLFGCSGNSQKVESWWKF